ncbi:MAG: DNA primase [Acidobacteriota bacterium]|jgi:DNA primase|nr:DNA primase [Acidobacteriota bacterium]
MPFYPDSILDEVRNSVNIVSVVSDYVPLRKRGRNHLARCPFHNEKTASFTVNEERQFFKCYGCGVGGDVFRFLMQIESLSFPEAVQFLAERQGITLPAADAAAPAVSAGNKKDMHNAMAEAAAAFQQALLSSAEGKPALEYLRSRGVTLETIEQFRLGYSPAGGNFLAALLQKKGFLVETLMDCGLCRQAEEGNRIYDYFRGRVMFPITDIQGRTVAFGARAMDDRPPKYLNSPETRLYNKSRNLFGLSYSKDGIRKRGRAVLVEGYMDCVIPFQHGVDNVVASCGTSLTPEQAELLGRYARDVVVSYDADPAGQNAAQKSLEIFLEGDFNVRVLSLPDAKDPDEYIRAAGVDEYREREKEAVPWLEFVLEKAIREQGGFDDPKKKALALNAVLPYLAKLPNEVERSEYVSRLAWRLKIEDGNLLAELRKAARDKKDRFQKETLTQPAAFRQVEKKLLQLILGNAELQDRILPLCSEDDFAGLAGEKIFSIILDEFRRGRRVSFEGLNRRLESGEDQSFVAQLAVERLPEEPSLEKAENWLNTLWLERLEARKKRIREEIAYAAELGDEDKLSRLYFEKKAMDNEWYRFNSGK